MNGINQRRGRSVDLLFAVVLLLAVDVLLFAEAIPQTVILALGVPFLLFLPGYAVVSALFPERPSQEVGRTIDVSIQQQPDWVIRIAMSVVTSAVVLGVVGIALSQISAIRLVPVLLVLNAVILTGIGIAAIRRLRLAPDRRADPLGGGLVSAIGSSLGRSRMQSVTMVVALLLLVGAVAYVGATPSPGESYSEYYLLNENEQGELVAHGFPETVSSDDGQTLYFGIENHERQPMTYSVIVVAQTVGPNGSVIDQERLDRFERDVGPDGREVVEHDVSPTLTGENVRIKYFVFEGGAPQDPDLANADQALHIWFDVETTATI